MKKYQFNKIGSAFAVAAALLISVSCSDDWNEHYDASTVDSGTLWSAIQSNGNLSNFTRVVKECGYDLLLNGSQTFSVFAPTDDVLSSAQADSLIAVYKAQKAAGVRTDDNTVVKQFLQNHMTLYKYPVSSLTNDSITMMNGKYEVLTGNSLGGVVLKSTNALYNNGVLFTLSRQLPYFPSVFEYLEHDKDLDSVYNFINSYSVYEFNAAKSVPGEIVDGQTQYLDSVSDLRNDIFTLQGEINSEDSTYWMVAPTNAEWNRMVEEYVPYFNYHNQVAKRDSLVFASPRMSIIGGTVFSRTRNTDVALRDSAVSTVANSYLTRRALDLDPYYIYFKPFDKGGVFDGTESVTCSNGNVLKASKFNVSKYETFMQTIKVEAEQIQGIVETTNVNEPVTIYEVQPDNPFYNKVSGNTFVEFEPKVATANPSVTFKVPGQLSNVEYDVYAVIVPVLARDTLALEEAAKGSRFNADMTICDQTGGTTTRRLQVTSRNFESWSQEVDTVLLSEKFVFPTCAYGLADAQTTFKISVNVSTSQTATFTRRLRLDCILLVPHRETATEESAKRAL